MYEMDVDQAKQVYNWFFHAFGSESNPNCTSEDIRIKDELERWLIDQGE